MQAERYLSGDDAEKWFISFTDKVGIASQQNWKFKNIIRKLNEDLNFRLEACRENIYLKYPQGDAWIDSVLLINQEPRISQEDKQKFCRDLLDRVVAIDAIIELKVNDQTIKIAVDVTTDGRKEDSKVQKVKGLREKEYRSKVNPNKNIPKVRKWLGIDKHLVLVVTYSRRSSCG